MPRSQSIAVRGIHGATTVEKDSPADILDATRRLLALMVRKNDANSEDVSDVRFAMTTDLTSANPADAALQRGWIDASLSCGHAMDVPNSLRKRIEILIHWNTDKPSNEINHVYLNGAKILPSQFSQVLELSNEKRKELEAWLDQQDA